MIQPQTFGVHLSALAFRPNAAVGVAPWGPLSRLIPDPLIEESAAGQKVATRHQREHKALRDEVQRVLKGTAKGKNVEKYAHYIAQGLRGERGNKWSTPPLCLWSSLPLAATDSPYTWVLPMTSHVVAIDAETQVTALHRISENPAAFGLTAEEIDGFMVPFEVHWGLSADDAKQIFHDRNWYGVPVAKTHALSMDQFDLATQLAQRLMTEVHVPDPVSGEQVALGTFVNTTKRQLGTTSKEWVTLSGLRSLVVTTLLGRGGIGATASAVSEEDLVKPGDTPDEPPVRIDAAQAEKEALEVLTALFEHLHARFAAGTAITTPACLAGIGIAANRVMSWCDQPRLTRTEFLELLDEVVWERRVEIWDGVAGRRTADNGITFGGGAKDSGGRVADALLSPSSSAGQQIRGRQPATEV